MSQCSVREALVRTRRHASQGHAGSLWVSGMRATSMRRREELLSCTRRVTTSSEVSSGDSGDEQETQHGCSRWLMSMLREATGSRSGSTSPPGPRDCRPRGTGVFGLCRRGTGASLGVHRRPLDLPSGGVKLGGGALSETLSTKSPDEESRRRPAHNRGRLPDIVLAECYGADWGGQALDRDGWRVVFPAWSSYSYGAGLQSRRAMSARDARAVRPGRQ